MKKYYFPVNGKSNEAAVIRGDHYRITVLTPSLLRLEYSKEDYFEDRATQSVIDRSFEVPAFFFYYIVFFFFFVFFLKKKC